MKITNEKDIDSSLENVYSYLTDPEKMQQWMGAKITRIGDIQAVDDVGSKRKVKTGLLAFEETITQFEPPKVCEYTVSTGNPIKEYRSKFQLKEIGSKCHIHWEITLITKYAALDHFCAFFVKKFTRSALNKLNNYAAS